MNSPLTAKCGRSLTAWIGRLRRVRNGKAETQPEEIVQRLQTIDALTADGVPVAEAIRSAGVLPGEYDRWRIEYNGLGRTLGPLLCPTPRLRGRRAA